MTRKPASPGAAPGRSDESEREQLLELLAQQQRVAQAGLITAALAHDINNHIQIISGRAFLALRSDHPDEWKQALEKVQEQCCALTDLTRSFLSFVRRRDTVVHGSFSVAKTVGEALRLLHPLAHTERVAIEQSITGDGEIRGEPRLLIQALVNIGSNAIRACAGGDGELAVRVSQPAPGYCRIVVGDNGPGIPEHLQAQLFRPFATGEAGRGGNGLGLFIVRQTVRKMGGTIRVATSSEGTTFTIDLPCGVAR